VTVATSQARLPRSERPLGATLDGDAEITIAGTSRASDRAARQGMPRLRRTVRRLIVVLNVQFCGT